MANKKWNTSLIPDQRGRVVVITGATSGLGKEAARVLSNKGAKIIMAVRNVTKGESVADEIYKMYKGADIKVKELDLANLKSVRLFAEEMNREYKQIDTLINNAGIMMCPFSKTTDDFEIQMGTNHLGHFALTGLLMPLLKNGTDPRIVVTSSVAHKFGNINFSDINWEKRKYNTNRAYGDSKIANLYFAYELVRKFKEDGTNIKVTASHPGWTKTELQRHTNLSGLLNNIFAQHVSMGTQPTLRAATDPTAESGDFFGPAKHFEMHGHPVKVKSNKLSQNREAWSRLWDISEQLTGVSY